jgi:hypothetical protein
VQHLRDFNQFNPPIRDRGRQRSIVVVEIKLEVVAEEPNISTYIFENWHFLWVGISMFII